MLEAIPATVLVFAFVGLLSWVPFNFSIFDPVQEVLKDFSYTDTYYAAMPSGAPTDTSIVLINIGPPRQSTRHELAALLQALRHYHPRVVGLDAYFLSRPDTANAHLAAAMRQLPQLVTGMFLHADTTGLRPMGVGSGLVPGTVGYLNFVGDDSLNTTVRYFRPFQQQGRTEYVSWAAQLVQQYDKAAYALLRARHPAASSGLEEIRYQGKSHQFLHLEAAEVLAGIPPAVLRDKLVLLGAMGEQSSEAPSSLEDLYFTPLNRERLGRTRPDMYGIVIQANIVAMLLHRDYIRATSPAFDWLLAVLICYGYVLSFSYLAKQFPLWYTPATTLMQFGLGLLLVYIAVELYGRASINLGTTPALLAVALVGPVLALFEALLATGRNLLRKFFQL